MKMIKTSLIAFVVLSIAVSVYADSSTENVYIVKDSIVSLIDSTSEVIDTTSSVMPVEENKSIFESFDFTKVLMLIGGLYELFVRLYPTEKNYSILTIVNSIINYLIPNKKKQGGTH